jgi:hypothetical protein
MRIACGLPKAKNTHSHYVILIAFPLQQWVHERAPKLRYTCIACPVQTLTTTFYRHSTSDTPLQLYRSLRQCLRYLQCLPYLQYTVCTAATCLRYLQLRSHCCAAHAVEIPLSITDISQTKIAAGRLKGGRYGSIIVAALFEVRGTTQLGSSQLHPFVCDMNGSESASFESDEVM